MKLKRAQKLPIKSIDGRMKKLFASLDVTFFSLQWLANNREKRLSQISNDFKQKAFGLVGKN